MDYTIEFEQEEDGRWIGEIAALPGLMAYGVTRFRSQIESLSLGPASHGAIVLSPEP